MSLAILPEQTLNALREAASEAAALLGDHPELQAKLTHMAEQQDEAVYEDDSLFTAIASHGTVLFWNADELDGTPPGAVADVAGEAGDRLISDFVDRQKEEGEEE